MFLGDSVSTQLTQFLICDLARSGVQSVSSHSTDLLVKGFVPTVSVFHFTASSLSALSGSTNRFLTKFSRANTAADGETQYVLRIHNQQFNLPCIHYFVPDCQTSQSSEELTANYLTSLIENYTHFSSPQTYERTVVVLNYGLHVRPKHSLWAIPGIAKAYLRIAKRYHKLLNAEGLPQAIFLYRETSSQVFTSNNCKCPIIWIATLTSLDLLCRWALSVGPSEYICPSIRILLQLPS